jgi:uncharacterized protein YdeI (YjbR/CyaY-like superfamily)
LPKAEVRPSGVAPDGRPMVQPADRAAWRAWLIANQAISKGVWLVSFRPSSGRMTLDYEAAVEEGLCVGWIDSKAGTLSDERTLLWFSPRALRSAWSRSNKERVARLAAAGLMLPAGMAAVDAAKQLGTWSILDEVEDLIVPPDLAAAFDARPPARANWDAFSRSTRRAILVWIVQAKRPETRAARIADTATLAARNEKANQPRPRG